MGRPEVATLGRRLYGERPKAFVVLGSGQAVGERELIDHVRSRIAHYKAPRSIAVRSTSGFADACATMKSLPPVSPTMRG